MGMGQNRSSYGSQNSVNNLQSVFSSTNSNGLVNSSNSSPPLLDLSEFPSLTSRGQNDSLPQANATMPGKQPYGKYSRTESNSPPRFAYTRIGRRLLRILIIVDVRKYEPSKWGEDRKFWQKFQFDTRSVSKNLGSVWNLGLETQDKQFWSRSRRSEVLKFEYFPGIAEKKAHFVGKSETNFNVPKLVQYEHSGFSMWRDTF